MHLIFLWIRNSVPALSQETQLQVSTGSTCRSPLETAAGSKRCWQVPCPTSGMQPTRNGEISSRRILVRTLAAVWWIEAARWHFSISYGDQNGSIFLTLLGYSLLMVIL